MPIILTLKGTQQNLEGKFNLTFKRKREDIKEVLMNVRKDKSLFDMFPSSIAQSLFNQFTKEGYIDHNQVIQAAGREFCRNPFKTEVESSIYSIDLVAFEMAGSNRQIVVNMVRRLTTEDRKSVNFTFGNTVHNNELNINDEKIYFESADNISERVYLGQEKETKISFNISENLYDAGFGYKSSGDINDVCKQYVLNVINSKQSYYSLTDDLESINIKSLKDFSNSDLMNGAITKIELDNIEIINMPIYIDDLNVATQYAYLFMYNKLVDGEYLTINEMNESFENEVLSKNIFAQEIKDSMVDFSFSEEGFKKYLEKDKYQEMSYKLNVMKTLLDVDIKDTRLHNVRNYFDLTNYLTGLISPNDVNRVNLVLGYSMAKNQKNKIIDCIEALQQKYNNITIIAKNDGSGQKTDDSIKESILTHGVQLKTNVEIGRNFHDRYILFEMKDGTYKCMLATNEVGQFFNLETSEPLGSIMVISNDEIVKAGKSLITMVKEAK